MTLPIEKESSLLSSASKLFTLDNNGAGIIPLRNKVSITGVTNYKHTKYKFLIICGPNSNPNPNPNPSPNPNSK